MFEVIAFDADDTLEETEMRNIHHFGYGIKNFTLSMVETAIRITQCRLRAEEVLQIVEHSKEMLQRTRSTSSAWRRRWRSFQRITT